MEASPSCSWALCFAPSFFSTGTILPSRPARGACRRAQRGSRMSRSSRPPRQRRVASLTVASRAAWLARVRDEPFCGSTFCSASIFRVFFILFRLFLDRARLLAELHCVDESAYEHDRNKKDPRDYQRDQRPELT